MRAPYQVIEQTTQITLLIHRASLYAYYLKFTLYVLHTLHMSLYAGSQLTKLLHCHTHNAHSHMHTRLKVTTHAHSDNLACFSCVEITETHAHCTVSGEESSTHRHSIKYLTDSHSYNILSHNHSAPDVTLYT